MLTRTCGGNIARYALCAALALAGLLAGQPASAQDEVSDVALEASVQRHLGLFLTTPDRREGHERVVAHGPRLEMWFLRPVTRKDRDEAVCDGFRWLLAGRLANAGGIRALLAELTAVDQVTLVFYDLETRVEPDARGRYRQIRNAAPHARFTISREKAALLRTEGLRGSLAGAQCEEVGRSLVDLFWTAT